ncbi:hypothetical protein ACVWW4_005915 [Bradyrhizobium sp. LB7.1]
MSGISARSAPLCRWGIPVRDRQARAGHVRCAEGPRRHHPARRPWSRHPVDRPGAGAIFGRAQPALGAAGAGRRPRRRRCRDAAVAAGAAARAAGRRGRTRRAHHARPDPAPGQSASGRCRRRRADRSLAFVRRGAVAGLPHPQRPAASSARSRARSRRRRRHRALFAQAGRLAAGPSPPMVRCCAIPAKPSLRARSA